MNCDDGGLKIKPPDKTPEKPSGSNHVRVKLGVTSSSIKKSRTAGKTPAASRLQRRSARITSASGVDETLSPDEQRVEQLCQEQARLLKLPRNSSYAVHRLKVVERALALLQLQRSEDAQQELEDILNSLSL